MIAIPGDTTASTISGIIADEAAIGMVNQKTTAVRVIPVEGKGVGRWPTSAADGLCADHSGEPDQLRSFRDPRRPHPRPNPQLQKLVPPFPLPDACLSRAIHSCDLCLRWCISCCNGEVAEERDILFATHSRPFGQAYGLEQNIPLFCSLSYISLCLV